MSKVAFIADVHLGVPNRLDDIVFSLNTIKEYCRLCEIDTVVVLGDLFHDRRSITIDTLVAATKFFKECQKLGQEWIAFPGNHDMFLRHSWDINSLQPLDKHLTIINEIKLLKLDDQRFWVLPFIQYEKAYMRVLKKLEEHVQEGDKLLTHVGVRGATLNNCFLLKDWSTVNFENTKFDKIYTGHFHSKQQLGNVWYPGSPIPFKFDEGDVPHGFYVYDTKTDSHKFINIWKIAGKIFPDATPPPQFYSIPDTEIDTIDESKAKHNMIRIMLSRDYTREEKRIIKERIINLGAKAVRWLNLSKKTETESKKLPSYVESHDLFDSWINADTKGIKDLDLKVLVATHTDIINEGDELYSIEEDESL